MKPTTFLYDLIGKLNRQEKRYLSLYLSKNTSQKANHQLELFKLLVKLESTDEELIKKKLKKSSLLKNFAFEKNKLYNLILRGLNDFHYEYDARTQVNDLLKQIALLMEKKLYDQANKRLVKAKKIAETHELNDLLFRIIDVEIVNIYHLNREMSLETNLSLIGEQKEVVAKLNNLSDFLEVYQHATFYNNRQDMEKLEEVVANPIFDSYENAQSFRAKRIFDYCKTAILKNSPEYFSCFDRLLNLYKNKPEILVDRIQDFGKESTSLIRSLLEFEEYDWAVKEIDRLENVGTLYEKRISQRKKKILDYKVLTGRLFLFLRSAQYDKVMALENQVIKTVYQEEEDFLPMDTSATFAVMGTAAFYLEENEKAIFWFETILKEFPGRHFHLMQMVSQFGLILCQYNNGNVAIVPHMTKAFRRKYEDTMEGNQVEKKILRFLEYYLEKHGDSEELPQKMEELHEEMSSFYSERIELVTPGWINYMYVWLEAQSRINQEAKIRESSKNQLK